MDQRGCGSGGRRCQSKDKSGLLVLQMVGVVSTSGFCSDASLSRLQQATRVISNVVAPDLRRRLKCKGILDHDTPKRRYRQARMRPKLVHRSQGLVKVERLSLRGGSSCKYQQC